LDGFKFNQKQYTDAINNYSYLIDAYPQSGLVPRAYYAIGDAYYNQGSFEQAISFYKKVVELYPSSSLAPEALKSMQYCYSALGKERRSNCNRRAIYPVQSEFAVYRRICIQKR